MTVTATTAATLANAYRASRAASVAAEVKRQIGMGPLMSLGAHEFRHTLMDGGSPALAFRARILPMKKDGTRASAPRIMHVLIWLTDADDYGIRVAYVNRGRLVKHYEASGIYCDQLARLILSLDFDGDTVRNPRLL
jgi:hypothetical protein